MKINHLIIGCQDKDSSSKFYCEILGYRVGDNFTDTGTKQTGAVLIHDEGPELLIVPFDSSRLPSPQHLALEVERHQFGRVLELCRDRGIHVRSQPPLDWKESGSSECEQSGRRYLHFYFCDPTHLNIEIMTPINSRTDQ